RQQEGKTPRSQSNAMAHLKVALPLPLPPILAGPDGQIPARPAGDYIRGPTIGWPIVVQQSARKFPSIADNRQDALRPQREGRGPVRRPCILRSIPGSISLSVPHLLSAGAFRQPFARS